MTLDEALDEARAFYKAFDPSRVEVIQVETLDGLYGLLEIARKKQCDEASNKLQLVKISFSRPVGGGE